MRHGAWTRIAVLLLVLALVSGYVEPVAEGAAGAQVPDAGSWIQTVASIVSSALRGVLSSMIGLLVGSARAGIVEYVTLNGTGCTGDLGTTNCWSMTSGGGGGAPVPGASDYVLVDNQSGTGTGLQSSDMSFAGIDAFGFLGTWDTGGWRLDVGTGGIVFQGGSGTLLGRSSVITSANGFFIDTGSTFTAGTSTVEFTNSGLQQFVTCIWAFYNFQVDASADVVLRVRTLVHNLLTVNGKLEVFFGEVLNLGNNLGLTDPITMGPGSSMVVYNNGQYAFFELEPTAGTRMDIPGGNYSGMGFLLMPFTSVGGDGYEFRVTGDVLINGMGFEPILAGAKFFLNTQSYNVTGGVLSSGDTNTVQSFAPISYGIKMTSGRWYLPGGFAVRYGNSTLFYMELGASTWTVALNWSNQVTTNAARWDAGTATLTFNSTLPFNVYPGYQLGKPEFDHVLFSHGAISVHGGMRADTITVQSWGTNQSSANWTDSVVYVQNFTVGTQGNYHGWHGVLHTCDYYAVNALTEHPDWSTVYFDCDGRVLPNHRYYDGNFYNVVVSAGVTSNWSYMVWNGTLSGSGEPVCDYTTFIGVGISNQLVVNGTIVSGIPRACYIWATFETQGWYTPWPLVIGPSGNVSHEGLYFVILFTNSSRFLYYLPRIYAYHISILDRVLDPTNLTVEMTGDIQTVDCIAEAHSPGYLGHVHEGYCAILLSHEEPPGPTTVPGNYNLYTNGHKLIAGGSLWIGDYFGYGIVLRANNSMIAGRPATVIGGAVAYFDDATVYGYPATIWTPEGFLIEYRGTVYAGNATFWICGSVTTWAVNSIFPGVNPPYVQRLFGENSTWHVMRSCIYTDPHYPFSLPWHAGAGPGDVNIMQDLDYFDLGNSTWYVDGNWTSASTSNLWNAGRSKIYFQGQGTFRINGTSMTGQGVLVHGGTNNRFWKVYFTGGTYIVQDAFSTEDVLVESGATWVLAPGVAYTVIPGSLITVRGIIAWNGNRTSQATVTSSGIWRMSPAGNMAFQYLSVGGSILNGGWFADVCNGGRDLGRNQGWNFAGSGSCMAIALSDSLPPLVVAVFIFTLIASGMVAVLYLFFRNEDFRDLLELRAWDRER